MSDVRTRQLAKAAQRFGDQADDGRLLQARLDNRTTVPLPGWRWPCREWGAAIAEGATCRVCKGTGYIALSPEDRVQHLAYCGHAGARALVPEENPDGGGVRTFGPSRLWLDQPKNFSHWLAGLPTTLAICAAEGAARLALPVWEEPRRVHSMPCDRMRARGGEGCICKRPARLAIDAARDYLLDPTPERRQTCGGLLMPEGTSDDSWWRCPLILVSGQGGPNPKLVMAHLFAECSSFVDAAAIEAGARARCVSYLLGEVTHG